MKPIIELIKIELKLFIRTFLSMFFVLVFPSMMLLIFGGIYGNEPSILFDGYGLIDVSVPAYFAMIIIVTGIMNLPLTVCGYRERKILKRFKATPINSIDILLSQIIVNIIMTIVGIAVLLVIGKLVFSLHFMGEIVSMIFVFFFSILSIFSLGFVIASVSSNIKSANAISNIIYFPMLFLSGATIPIEIMPQIMITISKILPATYAVELLKGVWLGENIFNFGINITVLSFLFVFCILISVRMFKWE